MGGNATSSGIYFQTLLVSKALASMLPIKLSLADLNLGSADEFAIDVAAETEDFIDDIRIRTCSRTLYIQAKTNLSFSESRGSVMMKVMEQFVEQNRTAGGKDELVLCVSTNCSKAVTSRLRELLDSLRQADGSVLDSWSKQKKADEKKLRGLVESAYYSRFRIACTSEEYHRLIRKMYVRVHDDSVDSATAQISWASGFLLERSELWNRLYTQAQKLCSNRGRISVGQLRKYFPEYAANIDSETDTHDSLPEIIPSGREVLLLETSVGPRICVLPRFDQEGQLVFETRNGHAFYNGDDLGAIILRGSSAESFKLGLTSPGAPLEHFVKAFKRGVRNELEKGEDLFPAAVAHSNRIKELFEGAENLYVCLNCGQSTTAGSNYLVEFDEGGLLAVGLLHPRCVDGRYRILGRWEDERFDPATILRRNEIDKFIACLVPADELSGQLFKLYYPRVAPPVEVEWGPLNLGLPLGEFAVVFESATIKEVYYRDLSNRIVSTTRESATDLHDYLLACLEDGDGDHLAISLGNPGEDHHGYNAYGYSRELNAQQQYNLEKVQGVKVIRLPQVIPQKFERFQFWAPLFVLIRNGNYIEIGNMRVVYSDPSTIDSQIAGLLTDVAGVDTLLVEDDQEFERRFGEWITKGNGVIVDPRVVGGRLTEGQIICDPTRFQGSAATR